jgi:hypothetical protein
VGRVRGSVGDLIRFGGRIWRVGRRRRIRRHAVYGAWSTGAGREEQGDRRAAELSKPGCGHSPSLESAELQRMRREVIRHHAANTLDSKVDRVNVGPEHEAANAASRNCWTRRAEPKVYYCST